MADTQKFDALDTGIAPDSFIHETAVVDPGATIGAKTRIWHFCHVMGSARIGERCIIGQNAFIGNVRIGAGVKLQNNISVYDGVVLEDEVFVGPSAVFTNIQTPRAHVERKGEYADTRVCKGATIGANATIVCGVTLGAYCFVGAGAVVTHDVEPHRLVFGAPARPRGWVCRCGEILCFPAEEKAASTAQDGKHAGAGETAAPTSNAPDASPPDASPYARTATCHRCGHTYALKKEKITLISLQD